MKSFADMINVFYGTYTEAYCKNKGLFVAYKKDGETVKAITRMIENYHQELVKIDAGYILGGWQEFIIENDPAGIKEMLLEILNTSEWEIEQLKIVLQGLILGTTALRVGKDEDGYPRICHLPISTSIISNLENGWDIEYYVYENNHYNSYHEISTSERYQRWKNEKLEMDVDTSRYEIPFITIFQNRPTIDPTYENWQGEPEWNIIAPQLDEINSSQSRLSMIEDRYANPKLIAKGIMHDANEEIRKDTNMLYISQEADISYLEYQGNIIAPVLARIAELKSSVKDKCPELILQDLTAVNSGYALKIRLQTLKKKINTLRSIYFPVFERYFSLLLKLQTGNDYKVTYHAEDAIPEDTETLLKEFLSLRGLDIISDRTIAESLGYDYDAEQKKVAEEVLSKVQRPEENEQEGEPPIMLFGSAENEQEKVSTIPKINGKEYEPV